MRGDVDCDLDRSGQIDTDDVLQVGIAFQFVRCRRTLFLDSPDTATKRFQFFGDYCLPGY